MVRTENAGVHAGTLESYDGHDGQSVYLKNARRIWKWSGAFTLSELSQKGIDTNGSRVAMAVPSILLMGAIEIIPTTPEAQQTIEACHE